MGNNKSTIIGFVIFLIIILIGLLFVVFSSNTTLTGDVSLESKTEKNIKANNLPQPIEKKEIKKVYAVAEDLKIELFYLIAYDYEKELSKTDFCSGEKRFIDLQIRMSLNHIKECKGDDVDCPTYICTGEKIQGENKKLYNEHPPGWGLSRSEGFSTFTMLDSTQSIHEPHQYQICCHTNDRKSSFCKTAYIEPYC